MTYSPSLLPTDTFNRARLYRLLNLIFRSPFLGNDLRLVRLFIEFKDLRADLFTGAAPDTLLFIYEDLTTHGNPPLFAHEIP